jgi:hypothetical protein
MSTAELIEDLAAEIGDQVYIDVAKWHLYLREARLHTVVAEKLYGLISDRNFSEPAVMEVLQGIVVSLGNGKKQLPIVELIPDQCLRALMNLLDDFQRKL